MTDTADFQAWIEGLKAARFKTWRAFAQAMEMTESGFLRGVRSGTLSVSNLIVLAELVGEPPLTVLRRAGKTADAAVLERVFGRGLAALTAAQRALLELWEQLPPADQAVVRDIAKRLAQLAVRTKRSDPPSGAQGHDPQPATARGRPRQR